VEKLGTNAGCSLGLLWAVLDPIAFGKFLGKDGYGRFAANAEEKSVPWGRDFYTEVDAFMAKYC
jgi:hypothetical protein